MLVTVGGAEIQVKDVKAAETESMGKQIRVWL